MSSNEINEVWEEEDEGQYNNCRSEELKDNTEKPCRNAVVQYKMNRNEEWKKGEDYEHTAKINRKIKTLEEYKTKSEKQKSNLYQLGSY